ncbi:MAG: hypothetical protein ABII96_02795, partial [Candidatus Zixiibacteriota bacterium]
SEKELKGSFLKRFKKHSSYSGKVSMLSFSKRCFQFLCTFPRKRVLCITLPKKLKNRSAKGDNKYDTPKYAFFRPIPIEG